LLAGSGSVKSRDLRPALSERGRVHVRTEGGHHYYQHGRHKVSVPQRLKGKGTIEAVIKLAIAVEDESDDADKEADNESHP
jgi:predicted RNA binding protein YcfA (HicA-like mRNA interferase family)